MSVCIATIISGNYLAYARVLADSLAKHEPEAVLKVLVVDRPTPAIVEAARQSGLQITYATELDIPDFEEVAYKYDILELNTGLKPTFLKRLFAEGFDKVCYLDPDIQLHAPLQPVLDALDHASIVLTPHALAPAMDGLRPSDIDFLRNGSFNLGFVGLRAGDESARLLDWWERRCLGHGFNDPASGTFVDQKWMDLVPSYFESVRVLRHPGCNVAYWNLHERTIARRGDGFEVDGKPLVFFHFSGVRASDPSVLSTYQNRHAIEPGQPLAELVAAYCRSLVEAGHLRLCTLPYSFGTLDDGTPITKTMRRASVVEGMSAAQPFSAGSPLQRQLRESGIASRRPEPAIKPETSLNFDEKNAKVTAVNTAIRLLRRLMGPERLLYLLRYAGFLMRESNYASVLLDRPFNLQHKERK